MKPLVLLLALLSGISIPESFSQNKVFSGYYINFSGDTIHGTFPGFKQSERNPNRVEFRTIDNKEIILTPKTCKFLQITGSDIYISYSGQRMTNPLEDIQSGPINSSDMYDTIHAFLRIIYQHNNVTIYSYKDKIRQNFFYKAPGKKIVELEKKFYAYNAGDNRRTTYINRFRDQLKEEFSTLISAKQLQNRLNNLSFTEKDLIWFMDLLNGTKVYESTTKYPAKLILGLGVAFNSLNITGDNSYFETMIKHESPVSPVLILGAKFYTKRNMGRILISPRVKIFSFNAKGDIDLTSGTANYNHKSEFKTSLIINPSALIGYNIINKPALKWYISAGIGYTFLINSKETQTTTYAVPPPDIIEIENPRPMVFVFNIETGVDIGKNIGIWFNYQPPAQTSAKSSNKTLQFSSFQAGMSWSFQVKK